MKIYVASSWRNPWQPFTVRWLRSEGHEVYDFREPTPGTGGFSWRDVDPNWRNWTPNEYRRGISHPIAIDGYNSDMDALRAADACVLVLPCWNSAHLELGWAVGAGKKTAVFFPVDVPATPIGGHSVSLTMPCKACGEDGCSLPKRHVEPELMARMAGSILVGIGELTEWAKEQ